MAGKPFAFLARCRRKLRHISSLQGGTLELLPIVALQGDAFELLLNVSLQGGSLVLPHFVTIQRSAKRYANLAKQDPGRARQSS